jgi:hypothetical protein
MPPETVKGKEFHGLATALRGALGPPAEESALRGALENYFRFLVGNLGAEVVPGAAAEVNAALFELFPLPQTAAGTDTPERLVRDLSALYVAQLEHPSFQDRKPTYYLDWDQAQRTTRKPSSNGTAGKAPAVSKKSETAFAVAARVCRRVVVEGRVSSGLKVLLLSLLGGAAKKLGFLDDPGKKLAKRFDLSPAGRLRRNSPLAPDDLLTWQVFQLAGGKPEDLDPDAVQDELDEMAWTIRRWAATDELCRAAFAKWEWVPRTDYTKAPTGPPAPDPLHRAWSDAHTPSGVIRALSSPGAAKPAAAPAAEAVVVVTPPPVPAGAGRGGGG